MFDLDKESRINLEELKGLVRTSPNPIALFAGAGTSAAPVGIRNWKELLEYFATANNISINIDNNLKKYEKYAYPKTATDIHTLINDNKKYLKFMDKCFIPKECKATTTHTKIVNVFDTIFTTNYDITFENAFDDQRKKFNIQWLPDFNLITIKEKPTIVYLHGYTQKKEYIFLNSEYEAYYPSISNTNNSTDELESFIKDILWRFNIIFVGFSFEDEYFTDYLKKLYFEIFPKRYWTHESKYHEEHPNSKKQHYVIMQKGESKYFELIKAFGFKAIRYDEGYHDQIYDIISALERVEAGNEEDLKSGK